MATQFQLRPPFPCELRGAELIRLLGDVVKLMLHQRAELQIRTLSAVICRQGNDEVRDAPEPFIHLLLHASLLPAPGAHHYLFRLTQYSPPLFIKGIRRPEETQIGLQQVSMVRVMQIAVVAEDLGMQPSVNAVGGYDADVRFEVGVIYEQGRRIWPLCNVVSHTIKYLDTVGRRASARCEWHRLLPVQ